MAQSNGEKKKKEVTYVTQKTLFILVKLMNTNCVSPRISMVAKAKSMNHLLFKKPA